MTAVIFPQLCEQSGLPKPVAEYRFHEVRKWRFDWSWPDHRVALEVEGGLFAKVKGRHARPHGIKGDLEKYNTAGAMGWIVLRILPEQLLRTDTIDLIRRTIATRKAA